MNTNKSVKNLFYSFFSQIIVLVLGLIVPRVILVGYGSDTNGFISTITQIITYIGLLEAGIGQATINELYPYVQSSEYDKKNISKVMSISRKSYRDITKVYALAVLLLAIILPFIIKTKLSFYTVFLVTFLEGATGVVSFYYIQNWTTLLTVDGKQYVNTNIELVNKIICYTVKIVLAIQGVNIVFLEVGFFVVSIIKLFIYKIYMDRNYGWVDYTIETSGQKLKDRSAFIVTEIAWTIFSSTDMIVLSVFCSTKEASVYSVYNMIFVAINSLLNAVYMSLKFNLGQSYHEDIEKYKKMHDIFNSLFIGVMSALMSVTFVLCIPFVSMYTSGIQDVNYINPILPIGFCLIQILSWCRMISGNLSGLAGYAKKVSYISIVEAIINIILSLTLVRFLGIAGVLIATVVALPLKLIYCNWLAEKVILKRTAKKTACIVGVNIVMFRVVVSLSRYITVSITSITSFVAWGIGLSLLMLFLFALVNFLVNKDLFIIVKSIKALGQKNKQV